MNYTMHKLFDAIYDGHSRTALQLIGSQPELVRQKHGFTDDYPLHIAIKQLPKVSMKVVEALVQEYPDACMEMNHKSELPLHVAARHGSIQLIRLIFNTYRDACFATDYNGNMPLHIALQSNKSMEAIHHLLSIHPDACVEKNNGGNLPLHVAVRSQVSRDIIMELIDINPDACGMTNNYRRLPLHEALYSHGAKQEDLSILSILIELHPAALRVADDNDYLPLHILATNQATLYGAFTSHMISLYPEACTAKNRNGELPLHLAAYGVSGKVISSSYIDAASTCMIKELLRYHPDGCKVTSNEGFLPLHNAARSNESVEAVKILIQAYPEACIMHNNAGKTPFHLYLLSVHKYADLYPSSTLFGLFLLYVKAHPLTTSIMTGDGQRMSELWPTQYHFVEKNLDFTRLFYNSDPMMYSCNEQDRYVSYHVRIYRNMNYNHRRHVLHLYAQYANIIHYHDAHDSTDTDNSYRKCMPSQLPTIASIRASYKICQHSILQLMRYARAGYDKKRIEQEKVSMQILRGLMEMDCPSPGTWALKNGLLMNVISYL